MPARRINCAGAVPDRDTPIHAPSGSLRLADLQALQRAAGVAVCDLGCRLKRADRGCDAHEYFTLDLLRGPSYRSRFRIQLPTVQDRTAAVRKPARLQQLRR